MFYKTHVSSLSGVNPVLQVDLAVKVTDLKRLMLDTSLKFCPQDNHRCPQLPLDQSHRVRILHLHLVKGF